MEFSDDERGESQYGGQMVKSQLIILFCNHSCNQYQPRNVLVGWSGKTTRVLRHFQKDSSKGLEASGPSSGFVFISTSVSEVTTVDRVAIVA